MKTPIPAAVPAKVRVVPMAPVCALGSARPCEKVMKKPGMNSTQGVTGRNRTQSAKVVAVAISNRAPESTIVSMPILPASLLEVKLPSKYPMGKKKKYRPKSDAGRERYSLISNELAAANEKNDAEINPDCRTNAVKRRLENRLR